jgi:hypothetical protein
MANQSLSRSVQNLLQAAVLSKGVPHFNVNGCQPQHRFHVVLRPAVFRDIVG